MVRKDQKKANHYFELAAIGGHEIARYNLVVSEMQAGKMSASSPAVNLKRAMKHFTIASGLGHVASLQMIKDFHSKGLITKDDHEGALGDSIQNTPEER